MKTGIVVGRFQVDKLTEGHVDLINYAIQKTGNVVIVLGKAEVELTNRYPIPANVRVGLFKNIAGIKGIRILKDHRDDAEWSRNLDTLIETFPNPELYHSRDSFATSYSGRFPLVEFVPQVQVDASRRRKAIAVGVYDNNVGFRQGLIYAAEHKFPTAYPTVDIALLRLHDYKTELLLGRKPGQDKYCFIGGFVDPTDPTLESAAYRELHEEVNGVETHEFKYVGSAKIDDFRYKGTKDGIITTLFCTYLYGGSLTPADDIEQIRWFDLLKFDRQLLVPQHHILLDKLLNYLTLYTKFKSDEEYA